MSTRLFLLAKKIHRLLALIIITLAVFMAGTGTLMKFPVLAGGSLNPGLVRYLHNQLSPYFTGVLLLMAITGFIMYIFPYLNRPRPPQSGIK